MEFSVQALFLPRGCQKPANFHYFGKSTSIAAKNGIADAANPRTPSTADRPSNIINKLTRRNPGRHRVKDKMKNSGKLGNVVDVKNPIIRKQSESKHGRSRIKKLEKNVLHLTRKYNSGVIFPIKKKLRGCRSMKQQIMKFDEERCSGHNHISFASQTKGKAHRRRNAKNAVQANEVVFGIVSRGMRSTGVSHNAPYETMPAGRLRPRMKPSEERTTLKTATKVASPASRNHGKKKLALEHNTNNGNAIMASNVVEETYKVTPRNLRTRKVVTYFPENDNPCRPAKKFIARNTCKKLKKSKGTHKKIPLMAAGRIRKNKKNSSVESPRYNLRARPVKIVNGKAMWFVEGIVGYDYIRGKKHYVVKWEGEQWKDSVEPEENLDCDYLKEEFHDTLPFDPKTFEKFFAADTGSNYGEEEEKNLKAERRKEAKEKAKWQFLPVY